MSGHAVNILHHLIRVLENRGVDLLQHIPVRAARTSFAGNKESLIDMTGAAFLRRDRRSVGDKLSGDT